MPAVNLDTLEIVENLESRTPLSRMIFTTRNQRRVPFRFFRAGATQAMELPGSATGQLIVKRQGQFGADAALARALEWTREGSGAGSTYWFDLDLGTDRMAELFAEAPEQRADLVIELNLSVDGRDLTPPRLACTVWNRYLHPAEGIPPAELPSYPPAGSLLTDAPKDGAIYARKDGAWVAVDVREMGDDPSASSSSGSGIGHPAGPSLRYGIVIWHRFNGDFTNFAGPSGALNVGGTFVPGKIGWAVDLGGPGKLVGSGGTMIDTRRSFSMNMWCKLRQDAVSGVYTEVAASTLDYRFKLGVWPGLIAGAAGASGWTRQVTGGTVSLDEWFMLTFVMKMSLTNWESEPGSAQVFVNGIGGESVPWWGGTSEYPVILGGNDVYAGWHGMLDEVGVWRRALSAGDITTLYNGGAGAEII